MRISSNTIIAERLWYYACATTGAPLKLLTKRSGILKIAICEDNESEKEELRALLEAELTRRRVVAEIVCFSSGEKMLHAMGDAVFPINFLDIYMEKLTGMELAREIRARDDNTTIVFTTSSPEFLAEGFDVGAVHYLIKPYQNEAVFTALDRCLRIVGNNERFIEVLSGGERCKLLLSQIRCIESQDKNCLIYLENEVLRVYTRLNDLRVQLDETRFLHCHKSFIVNLDHTAHIKGGDFVMKSGKLVPIRREDRAAVRELYQSYNFEKVRREL